MLQHRQIRIHKSLHTILHTPLLLARQFPRRQRPRDAPFETYLAQFVDRWPYTLESVASREFRRVKEHLCLISLWKGKGGKVVVELERTASRHTALDIGLLHLVLQELLDFALIWGSEAREGAF